jgi:hypothetical protein
MEKIGEQVSDFLKSEYKGILPIARSKFGQFTGRPVFISNYRFLDWALVGHGEAYNDCGHFWTKGCLDVEAHRQAKLDADVVGKVYVKVIKRSCARAECPICHESWAGKEANKIEYRLGHWKGKGRAIHLVVSPPKIFWGNYKKIRSRAYKEALKVGFWGGSVIFHPFREACYICGSNKDEFTKTCVKCGSSQFGWYFSPHFHMIGFGWIKGERVAESFRASGWLVRNVGVRDSVSATAFYQLSHAGINPKYHTITWFGRFAYNKLKVPPKPISEKAVCPLCQGELYQIFWRGEGLKTVPDVEGDYIVEAVGWEYRSYG